MTTEKIMLKMVLDRWNGSVKNMDTLLQSLSDDALAKEVAPGKNRGLYLLGHLIAVHDDMLVLLGMGDKMYPDLFEMYIKTPDKAGETGISAVSLRAYWKAQNEHLNKLFEKVEVAAWFEKHTAVSEADFVQEPHRNKLNIIITRTTHLAYHTGQLQLLK